MAIAIIPNPPLSPPFSTAIEIAATQTKAIEIAATQTCVRLRGLGYNGGS